MKIQAGRITLYHDRCKKCRLCVDLCPSQVYVCNSECYPDPVKIEKCTNCGMCELWCPDYAIEIGGDTGATDNE